MQRNAGKCGEMERNVEKCKLDPNKWKFYILSCKQVYVYKQL